MLPLNDINIQTRRRASVTAACLIGIIFAAHVAVAAEGAPVLRDGDVRKAEKVLARLRLLYDAAGAGDAHAYRDLTSKFYPGLFVTVAELPQGDLSTDLSTAVFLAEELGRTWSAAGAAAADCGGERPDIYRPLCLGLTGGTRRQLLFAKSRLHARWAEAVVRTYKGESGAEDAQALSEMAAARANDLLIAARVVEMLKAAEGVAPLSPKEAGRGNRFAASAAGTSPAAVSDGADGELADALRIAGALLTWLPRSPAFHHLSGARLAFADGLSWYRKARQSKKLVISANAYEPDPLRELRLDAQQVSATAKANWNTAARHTRLAEEALSRAAR